MIVSVLSHVKKGDYEIIKDYIRGKNHFEFYFCKS